MVDYYHIVNRKLDLVFLKNVVLPYEIPDSVKGEGMSQLSEEIIRVAVVGPIKSGKSTFTNSVLKGDYLKRGAGVVTSIVTRVRRGKILVAKLFFKSWDEVNAEVDQARKLEAKHGRGRDAFAEHLRGSAMGVGQKSF